MEDTKTPYVGQAIRSLREGKNLSLRDLSQQCGLSINAISKIERGEASPTVASLHKLAPALGVHITDLFTDKVNQTAVFTPRDNAMRIHGDGILIEELGSGVINQKLEPFRMVIESGAATISDPASHSGEEFVHYLDGELEYQIGNQRFLLKPGDSLIFKSPQPHSWQNSGDTPATVLLVFESDQSQPVPHHFYSSG